MNNRDSYFRSDITLFNLSLIFLLAVIAMVLLYAPAVGSFNMFIPFSCLVFNMIFTYTMGLQRGLMLAIVLTFVYGSYIVYDTTILNSVTEVNFSFISWMLFFPLSSIIVGQLALTVSDYKRGMEEKETIEKLVTVDADTGFYKNQEFFKRLDEEFTRAQRYKTSFTVLLIQISNFAELQIIYGEIDSINILRTISERVAKEVRLTDSKFLVGNDTLSILLTETNEEGAKIVIEKLHMTLDRVTAEVRDGVKKVVRVKPNIGYASYRETDKDSLEVYDRAMEELNYDKG